jgi:predicted MFS family arabinose efflux permease
MINELTVPAPDRRRERLLRILAAVSFLIFFQAYMVAPIIPSLSISLNAPVERVALIVPAYLIPYGIGTLIYGVLGDRFGVHRMMYASLVAFSLLAAVSSFSRSVEHIIVWRVLTGIGASGAVPLAVVLVGRLYPFEQRGHALGWLFGAMAGGMALGSPLGSMLLPHTGWRGLFVIVAACGTVSVFILQRFEDYLSDQIVPTPVSLADVFAGYLHLLRNRRALTTYSFVFLNSMFHSGIFTWLGVYIEQRYHLGPTAIGLALLGYGIPGAILGPMIGRVADRYGRASIIPAGLALASTAAIALAVGMPLAVIPFLAAALSL